MKTVHDIIALWPSASELARDLGLKRESHGTVMKARGSIPVVHWPRLISAAKKRGIKGITYEVLVNAHARPSCGEGASLERQSASSKKEAA
ncbi:hypothetical protein AA309_20040 [Microvirga vignae]|uniref:Uncharacterized protein n=1 Tax=Microvirga vignae TaxID=1225564 RepID=A0A0H1R828_9HYPH|nr:hypothetical protein [Microvirga vignae]KLK91395.1 hypothetical protein AA309_20040 [Microvirga vignae]